MKKKLTIMIFTTLLIFSLSACYSDGGNIQSSKSELDNVLNQESSSKIEKQLEAKWLVFSETDLNKMSEEDIVTAYINSKLFEFYYRDIIYSELNYSEPGILYYPDSLDSNEDDTFTLKSILSSLKSQKSFYTWIESVTGVQADELVETVSSSASGYNIDDLKKYILNLKIVDEKIVYSDLSLFSSQTYLNNELSISVISMQNEKVNANNDKFLGGK